MNASGAIAAAATRPLRALCPTHLLIDLPVQGLRLYKSEKLCSRTAVNLLFEQGRSRIAYPLRVVYRVAPRADAPAQFLITVPKKKIRRAVQRVLLRRRIREAYRLQRRTRLHPALDCRQVSVNLAFVYLSDTPADYATLEHCMRQLLDHVSQAVASAPNTPLP